MSKADEFRQYAEEAMGWARDSKDEKQRATDQSCARLGTGGGKPGAPGQVVVIRRPDSERLHDLGPRFGGAFFLGLATRPARYSR
jgi:hypothetical protein